MVKVTVERVRVADACAPLPSDEVTTVVDAFQTFVVWPRHLIRIILEPLVIILFHYINYIYILYLIYYKYSLSCRTSLETKSEKEA